MLPNKTKMPDWTGALCAQTDPELFFPDNANTITARMAKKICQRCPLIEPCLEYAMKDCNLLGIWAGTSIADRDVIRARRNREKRKAC